NGTYTKHLLQYITQPNLEVGMLLRRVRTAVKEETGGQQVPWENGSIEGEFYFNGTGAPPVAAGLAPQLPQMAAPPPTLATPAMPAPSPNAPLPLVMTGRRGSLQGNRIKFALGFLIGSCGPNPPASV